MPDDETAECGASAGLDEREEASIQGGYCENMDPYLTPSAGSRKRFHGAGRMEGTMGGGAVLDTAMRSTRRPHQASLNRAARQRSEGDRPV